MMSKQQNLWIFIAIMALFIDFTKGIELFGKYKFLMYGESVNGVMHIYMMISSYTK